MDQLYGIFLYTVFLLTMGGIYAVLALGLNIQWGFTGLFNAGVAGFFAIGAYVTAIVTAAASPRHLGGYGLSIPIGIVAAMVASAIVAWVIGRICIRLRSDYLAIATLGIAEILRLVLKNEMWATNGARGISQIPKPFEHLPEPWNQVAMLLLVFAFVLVLYLLLERARRSPWGRVMAAIRGERGRGPRRRQGRGEAAHRSLHSRRRAHGTRRRADRSPHQVHRAQRCGAGLGNIPCMGYADHRRERE